MMRNLRSQRNLRGVYARKWKALHVRASYIHGGMVGRLLKVKAAALTNLLLGCHDGLQSKRVLGTKWIWTHLLTLCHKCSLTFSGNKAKAWAQKESWEWSPVSQRFYPWNAKYLVSEYIEAKQQSWENLSQKLQAIRKKKKKRVR